MYRLSDQLIAQIAQILQIAILDGTDIVDHLRSVWVEPDGGQLVPTAEYLESFNKQIEDMVAAASELQAAQDATADE